MKQRQAGLWDMEVIRIARLALQRSGAAGDLRKDRGFWWTCYCSVCCQLRALAAKEPF